MIRLLLCLSVLLSGSAQTFVNHLSQPVEIDLAGVGANPYSGPGIYAPNWFDENGDDVGWGYYVAVPPGGVVPLAMGATFSLYDPENGSAYVGGDDALVYDPNTFFEGNSWWHQGFIEGDMNLGSPDGTMQKARLLGAPSVWDGWNATQAAAYGAWFPPGGGGGGGVDGNAGYAAVGGKMGDFGSSYGLVIAALLGLVALAVARRLLAKGTRAGVRRV